MIFPMQRVKKKKEKKRISSVIISNSKSRPDLHIVHAHYVSTVIHVLLQVLILPGEMTPSDRKQVQKTPCFANYNVTFSHEFHLIILTHQPAVSHIHIYSYTKNLCLFSVHLLHFLPVLHLHLITSLCIMSKCFHQLVS